LEPEEVDEGDNGILDDSSGSGTSGTSGSGVGPASKRRRRGSTGGSGVRRFEEVKQDILSSKGLVRRSQEAAALRASRWVCR
jgi:hypothetical protein